MVFHLFVPITARAETAGWDGYKEVFSVPTGILNTVGPNLCNTQFSDGCKSFPVLHQFGSFGGAQGIVFKFPSLSLYTTNVNCS